MKISTTREEVEDILLRLNVHKASGVDGIPARILKIYAKDLSWPLTYLFNLSFTLGEGPSIWKRANITPAWMLLLLRVSVAKHMELILKSLNRYIVLS